MKNQVTIYASNMVGIRYFSVTNPWLDFVVYTTEEEADSVANRIRVAMTAYWNYEWEAYGDALYDALQDKVAFIVFHDTEDESEEYEEAWDAMLDGTRVAFTIHSYETMD